MDVCVFISDSEAFLLIELANTKFTHCKISNKMNSR